MNNLQVEDGSMLTVGVLNLQGAISEHLNLLNQIPNVKGVSVKYEDQLNEIDGIIIPGGESTTIAHLLKQFNLLTPLQKHIENGLPVWGTCAGMILLAKSLSTDEPTHLNVMDITVKRNAYGRQSSSFSTIQTIPCIDPEPIPLVFIRAPYVIDAGPKVQILSTIDDKIIACEQNNMLATTFHPELTDNLSFHQYFVNMIKKRADSQS
ncbi:MAG: pyridoxal 5'-phosphate synthase glutaminase subunit PdxT [Turicibacter sp.]